MLTTLAALLLASSPLQDAPAQPHPEDDCADIRRLELSPPMLSPPRICVSPGLLTGLVFDRPVDVEIQEEVRFAQVIRGREVIGLIPPRDMLPGEQLRLTTVLGAGETRQSLTFVLVAHPGQGSHQVEVNYNERSRQALSDALGQAVLSNRRLSEAMVALQAETDRMRTLLGSSAGLCGAYAGGQLGQNGIATRLVRMPIGSAGELKATSAMSYRGTSNIAVEVVLKNQAQEPWSLEDATLVNARGETLKAVRFRQTEVLLAGESLPVFVEFDPTGFALEGATLTLAGGGERTLSLPNVVFP